MNELRKEPPRLRSRMTRMGSRGFLDLISMVTKAASSTTAMPRKVKVAVAAHPSEAALVNP